MFSNYVGCLLGGAIGDAIGYQVEFMNLSDIRRTYGAQGVKDMYLGADGKAPVSDDTQMTLFTANGLRWAVHRMIERGIGDYVPSGVYPAYLRWLATQGYTDPDNSWVLERQLFEETDDPFIMDLPEIYAVRSPGATCISALQAGHYAKFGRARNSSKGCGANMRVAPIGLALQHNPVEAFRVAAFSATITHGHDTAAMAAGATAMIIAHIIRGEFLPEAIRKTLDYLSHLTEAPETVNAIEKATRLADEDVAPDAAIADIGGGWVAEEALAIALYAALTTTNPNDAILRAVNHSGDSDSTGSICGSIVGAMYGEEALRLDWCENVEFGEYMQKVAEDMFKLNETICAGA